MKLEEKGENVSTTEITHETNVILCCFVSSGSVDFYVNFLFYFVIHCILTFFYKSGVKRRKEKTFTVHNSICIKYIKNFTRA